MDTKITKIDKATCATLRDRINTALSEAMSDLGLAVAAGRASYDDNTVTFKVEFIVTGFDKERHEFDAYCHLYGLTPDDYGSTFKRGNAIYSLVGLNPKAPKYPIIGKLAGGKKYRFTRDAIRQMKDDNEARLAASNVVEFPPKQA